jgi:hypothetical protein
MVKHRVDCGQQEDITYYVVMHNEKANSAALDIDEEIVGCNNAELMLHYNVEQEYYRRTVVNIEAIENKN